MYLYLDFFLINKLQDYEFFNNLKNKKNYFYLINLTKKATNQYSYCKMKFLTVCLLFFVQIYSQVTNNDESLKNLIGAYFLQDREIIHVQFNKYIYVNNEDIAFKGYVLSQMYQAPHPNTTNVQLVIYDEKDQIVQKQLLYTNKGTFEGGLHLSDKFKSGRYFFHFYTNWMNNFIEDDSFTQTVEIIDKKEPYQLHLNEPNYKTVKVTFYPEGGTLLNDMHNNIGIKITDCNQKGIEIKEGIVLDSKQNEIIRFNTNKMGNGIFYLIPSLNETYSIRIKSDKISLTQALPPVAETGIVITYNNNLPKNLIVAVKTNDKGLDLYKNKKMTLLIHQGLNFIQKELMFTDAKEKIFNIDKQNLSNGVNSIRLIDENLNQVTERLLYHYAENKPVTVLEAKAMPNDSIIITGKTDLKLANLSLSILPENNICSHQRRSILGTFLLNAYLEKPEINTYSYFDSENNDKKKEMELLMINQPKSKYKWENIKNNPPKLNYKFNRGVTISGKVAKKISVKSKYKISLISLKTKVFDETTLDENNEFKFENFYAQDSTTFIFQLVNDKNISKYTEMTTKVSSDENSFLLPHQFEKNNCPPAELKPEDSFAFTPPKLGQGIVNLSGVTIKVQKQVMKHKNDMSFMATGFKIDDNQFGSVLDFIGRNGYKTGINPNDNSVFINDRRSFSSNSSPQVYIDNVVAFDLNMLFSLQLNEVDEIYIDKSGSSDIGSGGNGTIKIFLKEATKNNYYRVKYSTLIVTTGFTKSINFKNTSFDTQKEFLYFGTLNWTPTITTNKNSFEIKSTRANQQAIQVLVEGFSPEGVLLSEIQKIKIQE